MTHPSFETLNDLVDARLGGRARAEVERHVASCASCALALGELRDCLAGASALPREVAPPADLWTDIRATIETRKVVPLPGSPGRRRLSPRWLAAAAVALVVLSSATTALVLRESGEPSRAVVPMLPAAWAATERGYVTSADDLRRQLDAQRDRLDAATVATVERSLASIDLAIGEARDALLRDPANAALSALLASNYRQKVDLLRRATQLASST